MVEAGKAVPWGSKESDTTEQLNNTTNNYPTCKLGLFQCECDGFLSEAFET